MKISSKEQAQEREIKIPSLWKRGNIGKPISEVGKQWKNSKCLSSRERTNLSGCLGQCHGEASSFSLKTAEMLRTKSETPGTTEDGCKLKETGSTENRGFI